jgi:hypothetical protein
MLRKTMVALAIAFALGGSALPTSAFAIGSAFGGGRMASGGYAYHSERVSNLHHGLLQSHGRGYESDPRGRRGYGWDPWGHWGAYYGPMI